jgi:hypothetical protein
VNFKEFWKILQLELRHKKEFLTLKQNKKFEAYLERKLNGELVARVIPESGKLRGPIPSNEFEGIWASARGFPRETRFVNRHGRLGSYQRKDGKIGNSENVSYITKLIDHIVQDQKLE